MNNLFGEIFEKMRETRNQGNGSSAKDIFTKERTPKKLASLKALVITLVLAAIIEYVSLVPLNIRAPQFVILLVFLIVIFVVLNSLFSAGFNKISKYCAIFAGLLVAYVVIGNIISLEMFHASSYQKQLTVDKEADFFEDNKTISYQSIPVVDRDSAMRLGDRKMGEIVDYVSQFEVVDSYDQINYENKPHRVTPLEYSDLIKWFTNRKEGLPAYIKVDMVTQDAEVVRLKEGMKYSQSELFGRNIDRHLRANYPTLMFESLAFEIDDQGIPYWIAPSYEYKIGIFGGADITGAVLVNAVNGEHQYYDIDKVPNWVDRVYPAELVSRQLENWGKYGKGFFNTLFSQKGVLRQTTGYNYVALDDDVFYYTGLTSVSKDASNVGFALINLRTKESKYYNISGAEEYSAMSSAEGQVQHLGYKATFPILVNAGGEPSYFMSLKDSGNLVKKYAFVSVENYQIVATGDSVAEAEKAYYALLAQNGKIKEEKFEAKKLEGAIVQISEAVKEGNSTYYFKVEGDNTIFIADISLSDVLPLAKVGDKVKIEYVDNKDTSEVITSIIFE